MNATLNQVTSEEFLIPSQNIDTLEERLNALNKRAKRLHCCPISFEKFGTERKEDQYGRINIYYHVRITGETPIINGWTFVATIQHTGNGNIVRSVPGVTREGELTSYREVDAKCDHCNKYRLRNDTYVVKNERGEVKQVGKSCLKDFTGHKDPMMVASMAEYLAEAKEACENALDDFWGAGMSGKKVFDLEYFLSWVHACIRKYGWTSKSSLEEWSAGGSTSDQAIYMIEEFHKDPDHIEFKPEDRDREEANAALEWIRGNDWNTDNDYLWNLHTACKGKVISHREFGLTASLFAAYGKAIDIKRERETASKTSEWQGNIGDKLVVSITCNSVTYSEACYGRRVTVTNIYHLTDEKGNRYTWFSSNDVLEKGHSYILKGTIKDHSEYQGIKQTVLTRCKIQ